MFRFERESELHPPRPRSGATAGTGDTVAHGPDGKPATARFVRRDETAHRRIAARSHAAVSRAQNPDPIDLARHALRPDEVVVGVGPAIAEELPRLADLGDLVEVHVANHQLLVVGRPEVAD